MRPFYIIIALSLLFGCNSHMNQGKDWLVAYKNDNEGNALTGSKKQLINAIRNGASIKIGWGSKGVNHSIEHLAEPIWIAVMDEVEVIAHLDPQVLSRIDWEELKADYQDTTLLELEWRVVLSTTGSFDAVWYNRKSQEVEKRIPQNHTMSWFIKDVDMNKVAPSLFIE